MKYVMDKELMLDILAENCALKSRLARATSDVDYIAMMANVDIMPVLPVENGGMISESTL